MEKDEVRIKQSTYDKLVELAQLRSCSVEEALHQALTEYIAQGEQPNAAR